LKDRSNVGDQVLGVYIHNDGKIWGCLSNSGYQITDRPNPDLCIKAPYENDLNAWMWFYIGYSRVTQEFRFFVRYEDHNWEDTLH